MYKDFLGNELHVGDDVVFIQLGYRNLLKGVIARVNPKTVQILHNKTNDGNTETKQFHDQVIVVNA